MVRVPPSTLLSTRQVDARTPSGSQTSLCPRAQDGAFCVEAPLFALQERWDIPSSATSALGTYPNPHTGPAHMQLTRRNGTPQIGARLSHAASSRPKATRSLFLQTGAMERLPRTSVGLFRGLGKGASPRGLNLPLQSTSDHRLSHISTLH